MPPCCDEMFWFSISFSDLPRLVDNISVRTCSSDVITLFSGIVTYWSEIETATRTKDTGKLRK